MDFLGGFPQVKGMEAVMVVVDREICYIHGSVEHLLN
jgi:hypothetical protein